MKVSKSILKQAIAALSTDEYVGFCIECGCEHCEIEPDAEEYECEECGAPAVYGAEQIVLIAS